MSGNTHHVRNRSVSRANSASAAPAITAASAVVPRAMVTLMPNRAVVTTWR